MRLMLRANILKRISHVYYGICLTLCKHRIWSRNTPRIYNSKKRWQQQGSLLHQCFTWQGRADIPWIKWRSQRPPVSWELHPEDSIRQSARSKRSERKMSAIECLSVLGNLWEMGFWRMHKKYKDQHLGSCPSHLHLTPVPLESPTRLRDEGNPEIEK